MKLIVGLGNPGKEYTQTRHNIGFVVVDNLVKTLGVEKWQKQKKSEVAKVSQKLLLAKPTTFMNNSGIAVGELVNFYKLDDAEIIVVHDDTEVPFGEVRVKFGGTSGGHNGINSIDEHIGHDYWRVRVGVGRDNHFDDLADYVLAPFTSEEQKELPTVIDRVTDYLVKSLSTQLETITFNALNEK